MSILANQPSTIAKVLDSSFKLYLLSFKKVIGFGIMIAVIYVGLGLTSNSLMPQQEGNPEQVMAALPLLLGIIAIFSLFSFVIYAAMIYRIDQVARDQEGGFAEALGVGVRKFPTMLLAVILFTIAVTVGFALLIIPGLILMLSLAFYVYFIVIENETGYQSLKASHRLVWKDWWRTLAVFTVPGVIIMIIFFCIGLIAAFLGSAEADMSWIDVVMNLFAGIYMPYFYVLGYVQYHDLKLRKSGSDLEARMLTE